MKTNYVILLCCALISGYITHAMELVSLTPSQKFQIKSAQDITGLPFKEIKKCVEGLSEKKRIQIGKQLFDSFTFNVAVLPKELRYPIILQMFDGDEKSAELFYKTPLFYACRKYHDVRKAIVHSSLSKKNTEKLVALLFRTPFEKHDKIINLATPSLFSQVIYSGAVLREGEYEQIQLYDEEIRENFFAQEDIILLTDKKERACGIFAYLASAGGIFVGYVCGIGVNFLACHNRSCSKEVSVTTILLPAVAGGVGALIGGCIISGRYARQNSAKIDI